jgi:uncharacterized protein YndB with AHSA1/START domain
MRRITDWLATLLMLAMVPVLLVVLATAAFAAKPTTATLTVEPNAAPAWGWATATGCGYGSKETYLDVQKPEALAFMSAMPDSSGCVTFTFTTDGAGTYVLSTRQAGKGGHWKTMATYSLPVE